MALTRTMPKDFLTVTWREKCPNTEFFLVRFFPHSDWIRTDTPPNTGKYGPEKALYLDTFHAVLTIWRLELMAVRSTFCEVTSI